MEHNNSSHSVSITSITRGVVKWQAEMVGGKVPPLVLKLSVLCAKFQFVYGALPLSMRKMS